MATFPTKYDTPLSGLDWLEWYQGHKVYHPGIDFNKGKGNDDCGQDVVAAKSGFVEFVHDSTWNSGGFGKQVILIHKDGTFSRYAHLSEVLVQKSQEVKEGKKIGRVGNTGTTYCHLHFEVFGKEMARIQSRHWRRWRYYPSGKTKTWVMQHYINPWEWLKDEDGIPQWAKISTMWAKKEGLINNFEGNPMSDYEVSLVLHRFWKKYINKSR